MANSSGYTPGPWECEEQWHGTAIKVVGSNETVAHVNRRADIRREAATAILISAAPDLLEACQVLLNVYDRSKERSSYAVAVLRISAAVDKAKGREDV